MKTVRVALYENRAQAEPSQNRLLQAGIQAQVHAESSIAKLWFVSRWQAGARLDVPVQQAQQAARLLRDWAAREPSFTNAIRCPECSSFRVDFPQFTEKSLLTNVAMGLLAELGFIPREYYCEDCHCMWAKRDAPPPHVRAHLAPNYFLEDAEPASAVAAQQGRAHKVVPGAGGLPSGRSRRKFAVGWGPLGLTFPIIIVAALITPGPHLCASEPLAGKFAVRPDHPSADKSQNPTYLGDVLPVLMGKCARCHNQQMPMLANWLDYNVAAAKRWEIKRRVWDSWHGTYFKQPMPVANGPEAAAITETERQLIRDWVEAGAPKGIAPVYSGGHSKTQRVEFGKRLFGTICAACHQPAGQGIPGRFPPLAGSDFLNADKHRAIKVVVNGLQGEVVVNGQHFNNAMPQFPLTDQDIACALTFVYNSFGNSGQDVTPEEVKAARGEKPDTASSTMSSTAKVPEVKSPYE